MNKTDIATTNSSDLLRDELVFFLNLEQFVI